MVLSRLTARDCPTLSWTLFATDINRQCIETAKAGTYSLHAKTLHEYKAYFATFGELSGQTWTAGPMLRDHIRFGVFDLTHQPRNHTFNLIVCANIFQYYNQASRLHYLENLIQVCRRPGYIYIDNLRPELLDPLGVEFLPQYNLIHLPAHHAPSSRKRPR
jgi:chemotaxis methyl-accepting protein methylase